MRPCLINLTSITTMLRYRNPLAFISHLCNPFHLATRSIRNAVTLVEVKPPRKLSDNVDPGEKVESTKNKNKDDNFPKISNECEELLDKIGIEKLNELQSRTFNQMTQGKNVVVSAPYGSGKSLAFTIPLVHHLKQHHLQQQHQQQQQQQHQQQQQQQHHHLKRQGGAVQPRRLMGLVVAPTSERAMYLHEQLHSMLNRCESRVCCFIGGTSIHSQQRELCHGCDVLVGTPGRIMDHIELLSLDMSALKHLVVDGADEMCRLGLERDVGDIFATATTKTTTEAHIAEDAQGGGDICFSMFSERFPTCMENMMKKYINNNDTLHITPPTPDVLLPDVSHVSHRVVQCAVWDQVDAMKTIIQQHPDTAKFLISTRSKKASKDLLARLRDTVTVRRIHEGTGEGERKLILAEFWAGVFRCLIVSSDVLGEVEGDLAEVDVFIQTELMGDTAEYVCRVVADVLRSHGGVNIVFNKPGDEDSLARFERAAGVPFTWSEIVQQDTTDNILAECNNIPNDTVEMFIQHATQKLQDGETPGEEVIASALSLLAERERTCTMSALKRLKGYRTFQCTQEWELQGTSRVVNILQQHFHPHVVNSIQGIQTCADKRSCVFDVPVHMVGEMGEQWSDTDDVTLRPVDDVDVLNELISKHQEHSEKHAPKAPGKMKKNGAPGKQGGPGKKHGAIGAKSGVAARSKKGGNNFVAASKTKKNGRESLRKKEKRR